MRDPLDTSTINWKPNQNGYLKGYKKGHPMASDSGTILQHRLVLWEAIGHGPHPCGWCAQPIELRPNMQHDPTQATVDHLDNDRTNNVVDNLAPCCRSCNIRRPKVEIVLNGFTDHLGIEHELTHGDISDVLTYLTTSPPAAPEGMAEIANGVADFINASGAYDPIDIDFVDDELVFNSAHGANAGSTEAQPAPPVAPTPSVTPVLDHVDNAPAPSTTREPIGDDVWAWDQICEGDTWNLRDDYVEVIRHG